MAVSTVIERRRSCKINFLLPISFFFFFFFLLVSSSSSSSSSSSRNHSKRRGCLRQELSSTPSHSECFFFSHNEDTGFSYEGVPRVEPADYNVGEFPAEIFAVKEMEMPIDSNDECEALKTLFDCCGGLDWKNTTGWDTVMTTCCQKDTFGVQCDSLGHVTHLNLAGNGLRGSLPSSFSKLTYLVDLNLGKNNLNGTMTGIDWSAFQNMKTLSLDSNYLGGMIPPSIAEMTQLQILSLDSNELIGSIPLQLCNLTHLVSLQLTSNHLEGNIPTEIGKLVNLETLILSGNELSGDIPDGISSLVHLRTFRVSANRMSGTIPDVFENMRNLTSFHFAQNGFQGPIPSSLCKALSLSEILLGVNDMSGDIPTCLGDLHLMIYLQLSDNEFTGKLPSSFQHMENVIEIDLSNNNLEGSLPIEWSSLKKLSTLKVSSNFISGSIPVEYAELESLESFVVNWNRINGSIPREFEHLNGLKNIDIGENSISGNLGGICSIQNLIELVAHGNNLTALCPDDMPPKWEKLELLSVGNNAIPEISWTALQKCPKLVSVDAANNQLSGDFPIELFLPKSPVMFLDLSNNHFTGYLPLDPCQGLGDNLHYLNVAGNSITGLYFIDRRSNCTAWCTSSQRTLASLDISYTLSADKIVDSYVVDGVMRCISPLEPVVLFLVRFNGLHQLLMKGNPMTEGLERIISSLPVLVSLDVRETGMKSGVDPGENRVLKLVNTDIIPQDIAFDCFPSTSKDGRAIDVRIDPEYWDFKNCFCRVGYYGKPPNCEPCMDHATCVNERWGNLPPDELYYDSGLVFANEGYWATPDASLSDMKAGTEYPNDMIACHGVGTDHSPCLSTMSGPCRDGYEGRKCSKCASGYFAFGERCEECPSGTWLVGFVIFIVIVLILIIVFSFFAGHGESNGYLKILVFFVQGLYYISLPLPSKLYVANAAGSSFFGIEVAGMECYFSWWTYYWGYALDLVFPIGIAALCVLLWITGMAVIKCCFRRKAKKLLRSWKTRCVKSFIFVEYLMYMSTCDAILRPIACEKDSGDHEMYMMNVPYERCSLSLRIISSLMIVVYLIGLPAYATFLIARHRRKLYFELEFLFKTFPSLSYWELVISIRRILFVAAFIFITEYSTFQALWAELVLGGAIVLQGMFHPFSNFTANAYELVSLALLIVNHVVATQFRNTRVEDRDSVCVVVFVMNCIFFAVLLAPVLRQLYRMRRILTRWRKTWMSSSQTQELVELED